eukprot:g76854.t1
MICINVTRRASILLVRSVPSATVLACSFHGSRNRQTNILHPQRQFSSGATEASLVSAAEDEDDVLDFDFSQPIPSDPRLSGIDIVEPPPFDEKALYARAVEKLGLPLTDEKTGRPYFPPLPPSTPDGIMSFTNEEINMHICLRKYRLTWLRRRIKDYKKKDPTHTSIRKEIKWLKKQYLQLADERNARISKIRYHE